MKILAVDDDCLILEMLPVLLANSGYHDVTVCDSAESALLKMESSDRNFDCFFFDIQMPNMDGIELCQKVRTIQQYKETPIIMLTAMSDKPHIDNAFASGATDYITKPFDVNEIGARARKAETQTFGQNIVRKRYFDDQTSIQNQFEIKSSPPGKADLAEGLQYKDPICFQGIQGVVDYKVLTNYLNQISKTGLNNSNLFAVKIDQAEEIYKRFSPSDTLYALSDIADAISETLHSKGFFLMSYVGSGYFVCISQSVCFESGTEPEKIIQQAIDIEQLAYNNGAPIDISISIGNPLTPPVTSYKSKRRIFRVAIARAEAKYNAKQMKLYQNCKVRIR